MQASTGTLTLRTVINHALNAGCTLRVRYVARLLLDCSSPASNILDFGAFDPRNAFEAQTRGKVECSSRMSKTMSWSIKTVMRSDRASQRHRNSPLKRDSSGCENPSSRDASARIVPPRGPMASIAAPSPAFLL